MQRHKFSAWPPIWSNLTRGGGPYAAKRGEIGVLRKIVGNTVVPNMCFLYIEHEGESYCGALIVDTPAFCSELVHLLQQHVGEPIRDIGDLDLTHLL